MISTNTHCFFYSGVFSQWYKCKFVLDGVEWNTSEQFMMAEKAKLFNDRSTFELILKSTSPGEQKALGRQVQGFDKAKWDTVARDIVYRGNKAKFAQNPKLWEKLRKTAPKILVEASPVDRIWGIGRGLSDPCIADPEKWLGTNWLGEVLTRVRDDLIQEFASIEERVMAKENPPTGEWNF